MSSPFVAEPFLDLEALLNTFRNRTALVTSQASYRFRDLAEIAFSLVNFLRSRGARKGSAVALYLPPSMWHFALLISSWAAGFRFIPLNIKVPLATLLEDLPADFLIAENPPGGSSRFAQIPVRELPMPELSPYRRFSFYPVHLGQEAAIVFTSGSTTRPKGVAHTVGNQVFSALGTNEFLGITEEDSWLWSLPPYHVGGLMIPVRTLLAGGVAISPADSRDLAAAVRRFCPTVISLVPTQLMRLIDDEETAGILKTMKAILLGGAPMPGWLIEKALSLSLPIVPGYGSTETCAQATGVRPGSPAEDYFTAGRPLPYRTVSIDADGAIQVGGKTVFKYYLQGGARWNPRKEGIFKSADQGRLDENGNLVVMGRMDQMFISGGENIHPQEIEARLMEIDPIVAAMVVPVPHPEFGEVPWAFVQLSGKMEASTVLAKLKEILPPYKAPKKIVFISEEDMAGGLKFSRDDLKQKAREMAGAQEPVP